MHRVREQERTNTTSSLATKWFRLAPFVLELSLSSLVLGVLVPDIGVLGLLVATRIHPPLVPGI